MRFIRLCCSTFFLLFGCHTQDPHTLVIGTISGPETALVQEAARIAETRFGLHIKIVEFNDYYLPNTALNEGSLDANIYQHEPYLRMTQAHQHYPLVALGKTFLYPMGLYAPTYHRLTEIPDHATIAIPNDPSNEARALMLLQQAHLIQLKQTATPDLHDIQDNPHHFQFKTLDAAQLPRVLPDVDAAIINTTFALPAGLSPSRDALLLENTSSPYANLMVIRSDTHQRKALQQFLEAFHSEAVKNKAKTLFHDAAIPAW